MSTWQTPTPTPPPGRPLLAWWVAPVATIIGGVVWTVTVGGLVSGLVSGHGPALPGLATFPSVLKGLWTYMGEPALAWPSDPRPGPAVVTWLCLAGAGFLYALAVAWVSAWFDERRHTKAQRGRGVAGRSDLQRSRLDAKGATRTATRTRPSLKGQSVRRVDPATAAVRLGVNAADPRDEVYLQHRDGVLIEGPTGSGKTWRIASQLVLGAAGFVLATSTKVDLFAATFVERFGKGRVGLFDPEGISGWPGTVRISLLWGCTDPAVAIRRARALVNALPMGDTKNSSYWDGKAATIMRCYLFAAAVSDGRIRDVRRWVNSRNAAEARRILRSAMPDWEVELGQILDSKSDSKDDVMAACSRLLEPLADPELMDAVDVPIDESLDLRAFVLDPDGTNTLYLLSSGEASSAAPIVAAIAAEVFFLLNDESQKRRGGQLDPPARLVLDEVNNIAPIPDLPARFSDTGGRGISLYAFAHNDIQNRVRWGNAAGRMFSENAPARLILPGLSGNDELAGLSRLLGDRKEWEPYDRGIGAPPRQRDVPILTPAQIRQLDDDLGLLIYRNAAPVLVRMPLVFDDPAYRERVTTSIDEYWSIVEAETLPERFQLTPAAAPAHAATAHEAPPL